MRRKAYRFGNRYELHGSTRQLFADGVEQALEPKAFELLAYLIEHRMRVVSRGELLDEVWKNRFLSESTIPRAVMKARQAIGDTGPKSEWIATSRRAGYRFIGEIVPLPDDAQEPMPAPAAEPPDDDLSVALLPFENCTGQAGLAWIELGLMSMTARALSADARLAQPSIGSLLSTIATLPRDATPREREEAVRRLLGVRYVVQVRVGHSAGAYVLDCNVSSVDGTVDQRLSGRDLLQLGQDLARAVDAVLFPQDRVCGSISHESADPLANLALARALQALGEQAWQMAAHLLRVVLDIEPLNISVQLEYLRALASLGDDAAVPLGERLLAHPRSMSDTRFAIATHAALGMAHRIRSDYACAKHHLGEAVRLGRLHGHVDEVASALNTLVGAVVAQHDFHGASRLLDEGGRLIDESANQVERARFLAYSALVAARLGDPLRSLELGHQAVRLSREHRLNRTLTITSLHLMTAYTALGRLEEAARCGEEAWATARSVGDRILVSVIAGVLCGLYRELRAPVRASRVHAATQSFDEGRLPASDARAWLLALQGQHAACHQDHDQAAAFLREAIAVHRGQKTWLMVHELTPGLVLALIQSGNAEEALGECAEAQALPHAAGDAGLRAALHYGRALVAHSKGQRAAARAGLAEVADTAPPGLWRARACLDGAWLAIEAGELSAARRMLRGMGPWLEGHPGAMMVDARFKYATAQYAAAHQAHLRYAGKIESDLPIDHAEIGRAYADALLLAPATPAPLPWTPWLPCAV